MMETTRDAARTKRPRPRRNAAPGVLPLEGRQLLSFAPVNPEFLVDDGAPLGDRTSGPEVAVAANGDFVVVWGYPTGDDTADLMMRRYFADGTPKTAADEVITPTTRRDRNPEVAMAPDGRFVIAWIREFANGDSNIIAARFQADGTNLGEITVPTVDLDSRRQTGPDVAISDDGSFGVVWVNDSVNNAGDVRYRAFDADGQPFSADQPVAASSATEGRPTIARRAGTANGAGPFQVITWTEDGSGNDNIGYRVYTGPRAGGPNQVANAALGGSQTSSVVAMDAAGNFTIAWTDLRPAAPGVKFRQFAGANSTPVTAGDVAAAAGATDLTRASIATASNGRFAITYVDATDNSVRVLPVTPTGGLEPALRFATVPSAGLSPKVALNSSGTRMVVVSDNGAPKFDVYARVFQRAQTPADYDGDGRTDVAVYGYGRLAYRPSRGGADVFTPFGGPQDVALTGDYDGDGRSDLAVYGYGRLAYRPSGGGHDRYVPFGGPQDRAIAGDYDGDGRTDLAVYGYGRLAYRPSAGGNDIYIPFGGPADRIIAGDYDGDGKADVAVYGYGRLAYRPSRGGTDVVTSYGGPQDQAVAGDYDGDGRTDLAVYGYGRLAYRPSSGGTDVFIPYGGPQDQAVAGDYDGDGKTDVGVYGYGRFAWGPSSGGPQVFVTFGGPADIPLPLPTPRAQGAGASASFRASVASARLLDYDSALDAVARES